MTSNRYGKLSSILDWRCWCCSIRTSAKQKCQSGNWHHRAKQILFILMIIPQSMVVTSLFRAEVKHNNNKIKLSPPDLGLKINEIHHQSIWKTQPIEGQLFLKNQKVLKNTLMTFYSRRELRSKLLSIIPTIRRRKHIIQKLFWYCLDVKVSIVLLRNLLLQLHLRLHSFIHHLKD